ncbi:TIGR03557 family F420-dependent LLM class oxidoreductase [Halobacterium sp. CBA1126]|uniref:TIGR03557 family F420-dependent LLM class oxidoreductase n=1 Tax=Halobacterium sp. CBA1126 TaxID=2668074 RepID=UPI0012FA5109|nr:TIGR03557 family F420-dependent LLM class oxidoreductase [Halobacterium sp. CBA1126]MUV60476.1 TIGR03557 family F420-dependent LLM class oxidoreductase [Halobacterium sp. CBA1126]
MVELGYTLSSEEHPPNDLVEHAARAEDVGFDFLSISDHFHPWVSRQGESGFVWSTLGGVAHATDDIPVGVGVVCPIMRYHPAVVAQASASVASMLDGRFFLGVGTGELLNEHVVGEHWPEHAVRLDMLEEAVEIIRTLWAGGQRSYRGEHFTVQNARLFTRPEETPPIVVSAYGPSAAKRAAEIGDGFWSVGPQAAVETWAEHGGEGPRYTQLSVCYAETEAEAIETAYEWWPNTALPGELASQLPTTAHFEQACELVSREDVADALVTGPDPADHVAAIEDAVDAGYDRVYVHQVGPNQEGFFEFYEEEVLPAVESTSPA